MSIFVLVHGAWHGSWCWNLMTPLLEKQGHKVISPDLPGLGKDQTPAKDITLSLYVETITNIINNQDNQVILVGHSMGGLILSEVAEKIPNKISSLVYLCAFMPENGQSLTDMVKRAPSPYMDLEFSKDYSTSMVTDKAVKNAFFNNCKKEEADYAIALLRPQAMGVFQTELSLTAQNYGSVKRIYIECRNDNAVLLEAQRLMIESQPVSKLYSIDTDHSPFYSTPDILGKMLNEIAEDQQD